MPKHWFPEVGRLAVRQILRSNQNELELYFRDQDTSDSHYQSIARMSDFVTRLSFGGWTDCSDNARVTSEPGLVIVRRSATDDDLRAFLLLWSKNESLAECLKMIHGMSVLHDSEKARIQKVATDLGIKL